MNQLDKSPDLILDRSLIRLTIWIFTGMYASLIGGGGALAGVMAARLHNWLIGVALFPFILGAGITIMALGMYPALRLLRKPPVRPPG